MMCKCNVSNAPFKKKHTKDFDKDEYVCPL